MELVILYLFVRLCVSHDLAHLMGHLALFVFCYSLFYLRPPCFAKVLLRSCHFKQHPYVKRNGVILLCWITHSDNFDRPRNIHFGWTYAIDSRFNTATIYLILSLDAKGPTSQGVLKFLTLTYSRLLARAKETNITETIGYVFGSTT